MSSLDLSVSAGRTGHRALLRALLLGAAVANSTPAMAARDEGQLLLQDKENKEARVRHATADPYPEGSKARPVVLPLDHGPRAETTPWMNKRRLARMNGATTAATAAASANTK